MGPLPGISSPPSQESVEGRPRAGIRGVLSSESLQESRTGGADTPLYEEQSRLVKRAS
ncbi:unnamed protein product, partial [Nesidiocoris tenuis]